jgi:hypothetical protein
MASFKVRAWTFFKLPATAALLHALLATYVHPQLSSMLGSHKNMHNIGDTAGQLQIHSPSVRKCGSGGMPC